MGTVEGIVPGIRAIFAARLSRTALSHRGHVIAFLLSGLALMLTVPSALWAQAYPVGGEFQVNTYTTGPQGYKRPGVSSDAAGNFVVVWDDYGYPSGGQDGDESGVFARRYSSTGAAQGPQFQVNTYTTGEQFTPKVGVGSAGDFVVVWLQNSDGVGRRFDSSGAPQGAEFMIGGGNPNDVAVDGSGAFVVVYVDNDGNLLGVFGQRYDSGGSAVGAAFQVNTYTTGRQRNADVALDGAGNFVVAWRSEGGQDGDGDGIFGQRFASNGSAIGGEFQVNTYTTGDQQNGSDVAADAAGNFLVVWRDAEQGTNLARLYDSSGTPGAVFVTVGTHGTAVGARASGGFVVSGHANDGDYFGVFGRRYDSAGNALGAAFQVNTFTTGYQANSQVAVDTAGDFVVVWASEGQDGDLRGVFGQRFSTTPVPIPVTSREGDMVLLVALAAAMCLRSFSRRTAQ